MKINQTWKPTQKFSKLPLPTWRSSRWDCQTVDVELLTGWNRPLKESTYSVISTSPNFDLVVRPADPEIPELLLGKYVHGHWFGHDRSAGTVTDDWFCVSIGSDDDFIGFAVYVTINCAQCDVSVSRRLDHERDEGFVVNLYFWDKLICVRRWSEHRCKTLWNQHRSFNFWCHNTPGNKLLSIDTIKTMH